jgi:hypothetical protein
MVLTTTVRFGFDWPTYPVRHYFAGFAVATVIHLAVYYFGGLYERGALTVIHFLMVVPTFLILSMVSNSSGGDWLVIAIILLAAAVIGSPIYALARLSSRIAARLKNNVSST